MVIITSAETKRELSKQTGASVQVVCNALSFRSNSNQARRIRASAMNFFKSFFIDDNKNVTLCKK